MQSPQHLHCDLDSHTTGFQCIIIIFQTFTIKNNYMNRCKNSSTTVTVTVIIGHITTVYQREQGSMCLQFAQIAGN